MKKKLKIFGNLFLVGVIVSQSVLMGFANRSVTAATEPTGPLKRVIVRYRGDVVSGQNKESIELQENILSQRVLWLKSNMDQSAGYKKITQKLSQMPIVFMDVDAQGEASLKSDPNVISVTQEQFFRPEAAQTTPAIAGGSAATGFNDGNTNFTGNGRAVALIDTGADKDNSALFGGQIISEACFSIESQDYVDVTVTSECPNGESVDLSSGSAKPCSNLSSPNCTHGTSTAGVVAMKTVTVNGVGDISGIAKSAKLIVIKNTVKITEKTGQPNLCGDPNNETETCVILNGSGLLAGLNRVLELSNSNSLGIPIEAVNISQGTTNEDEYDSVVCNAGINSNLVDPINALKLHNIAVVIAAGNSGENPNLADKISSPACLSGVVSVSASSANHHMAYYTNSGPLTSIVAPGGNMDTGQPNDDEGILLPVGGNSLLPRQGTSFSAPLVAGAFALMREKNPTLSSETILDIFKSTGTNIQEARSGYTPMTHKEINIPSALTGNANLPNITTLTANTDSPVPAGSSQTMAVSVANADTCKAFLGNTEVATTSMSNGTGNLSITLPDTGTGVAYTIRCNDSAGANSGYYAQKFVSFALSSNSGGGNTGGGSTGSNGNSGTNSGNSTGSSVPQNVWAPGAPDTGLATASSLSMISIAVSALGLVFLNKSYLRNRNFTN